MPQAFVTTPVFTKQNVSSTAVALSGVSAISLQQGNHNFLRIEAETNPIRYRWDGSSPTAAVGGGELLPVNTPLNINGRINIRNFRMIRAASGDAVVNFTLDQSARSGGIV